MLGFPRQARRAYREGREKADMHTAQRIRRLEEALLDYVERYGATDLARLAFRHPDIDENDGTNEDDATGCASDR